MKAKKSTKVRAKARNSAKKKKPVKVKRKSLTAKAKKPRQKSAKPIGKVTHFFGNIRVAIVRFNQKVSAGTELRFKGATTDFKEVAKSMQYDHEPIGVAPKGKQVGIKVKKKVREGDLVYRAE